MTHNQQRYVNFVRGWLILTSLSLVAVGLIAAGLGISIALVTGITFLVWLIVGVLLLGRMP